MMKIGITRRYAWVLIFALAVFNTSAQENWSPEHVYYGLGGALTYTPDAQGNIIPDFSHVGYQYGDDTIPFIEVKVEVAPVDGDDGATIQAAIDSVSEMPFDTNGFRGAILLKKGYYEVADKISITASGVVLRGEGQTDTGTVIMATGTVKRDLINVGNGSSRSIATSSKTPINEAFVPVGRKYVILTDASGFSQGDQIVLYRPGTTKWISDIKMDQITPGPDIVQWKPSSYSFYFERLVTGINGDTIFFRNPVVMAMETQYGGGYVYKFSFDRLENVGIENLCLKSAYQSETDENHGWKAIKYNSIENGWVWNVTSWYFGYSCVSLERNSRLISVLDCHSRDPKSIISGGRRYSFNLVGSLNLFRGCTTTEGRHDFVNGSRVCGPNVFTQCTASNAHSDSGPHHRWAMGTLYDIIESDGAINVRDRDDSGTGHGWAGANQVFWNCNSSSSICESPWTSALNYNFGFMGSKANNNNPGRPDGEWVGHNMEGLFPASLYEAQLDARMRETRIFSALPNLLQVNDSTYLMEFTLPVEDSTLIADNFAVSGTAGLEGKQFVFRVEDEYTVELTFSGIGTLSMFSSIKVKASNLISSSGLQLEGLNSSIFIEPDKRPIVSGPGITIDNQTGFLEVSSNKPGVIYLAKYRTYNSIQDLDSEVNNNLGKKVDSPKADSVVSLYTNGLPEGNYKYYAGDDDGRISKPSINWVKVQNNFVSVLPVRGSGNDFTAWHAYGNFFIKPANPDEEYYLEIFDVSGRLLLKREKLKGEQEISMDSYSGIALIRKVSSGTVNSRILILH